MSLRSSLVGKLLFSYLTFTAISLGIVFISLQFWNHQKNLNAVKHNIQSVNKNIAHLNKYEKDFFTHEIINPNFYASGSSVYLQKHDQAIEDIKFTFGNILTQDFLESLNKYDERTQMRILRLNNYINEYQNNFKSLVQLLIIRGFKDYGIEGRMRSSIHKLEDHSYGIPTDKILTLRRHEKDYIIRKDPQYAKLLELKANQILDYIHTNNSINANQRKKTEKILTDYLSDFNQLQKLEKEIGLNQEEGLQKSTADVLASLNQEFDEFIIGVNQSIHDFEAKQIKTFIWFAIGLIILSIMMSIWFSRYFSKPIKAINQSMDVFTEGAFEVKLPEVNEKKGDELELIQQRFHLMANLIEEKVSNLKTENANLLKSNQQLERFSHIVSHDLKSPLRAINSFVGLLKRKLKKYDIEEEMQYMQYIQDGTVKMTNLINDLLSFSKINSQEISVDKIVFDEMMDDVFKSLSGHIKESNAVVDIFNQPILIFCDEIKIKRVFQNLISNAIKYVGDDVQPQIQINCKTSSEFIQFSVEDNGVGIPKDQMEKLFQPFVQLHDTSKYEGTGLGLSICKEIIQKHGGRIWVDTEEDKGSTFYFTISRELEFKYKGQVQDRMPAELMV